MLQMVGWILYGLISSLAIVCMSGHCKNILKGIIKMFIIPENKEGENIIISICFAKSCKMVTNTRGNGDSFIEMQVPF